MLSGCCPRAPPRNMPSPAPAPPAAPSRPRGPPSVRGALVPPWGSSVPRPWAQTLISCELGHLPLSMAQGQRYGQAHPSTTRSTPLQTPLSRYTPSPPPHWGVCCRRRRCSAPTPSLRWWPTPGGVWHYTGQACALGQATKQPPGSWQTPPPKLAQARLLCMVAPPPLGLRGSPSMAFGSWPRCCMRQPHTLGH